MKNLSFYARWFLLFIVLSTLVGPKQSFALSSEPVSQTTGEVSTTLSLEETEYDWNDSLSLGITFENLNSSQSMWVTNPDACTVDTQIEDADGNVVSDDTVCAQVVTSFTLGSVSEITWDVSLDSLAGLPAGTYTLVVNSRATVENVSTGETSALMGQAMRIDFDLAGPLLVTYETNKGEYSVDDIMDVSYTIDNQGGETFFFTEGACRPYVTLYDESSGVVVFDEFTQGNESCDENSVEVTVEANSVYRGSTTFSLRDEEIQKGHYRLGLSFDSETPAVGSDAVAPFGSSEPFYVVQDTLFTDITFHWAYDYITTLYVEGVVVGYGSLFMPDQAITRAELLKLIYGAENLDVLSEAELSASQSYFTDVSSTDWVYPYTQSAFADGYVTGYEDNSFAPNQSITRAEAMSVLLLSIGYTEGEIFSADQGNVFNDEMEEWQEQYIMFAYNLGIVRGYHDINGNVTGYFGPNDTLTRAEACKIVLEARALLSEQQ